MEDSVFVPSGFDNQSLWSDLLKRWLTFLEAYERVCDSHNDSDLAYWHVEKSLTGLLGAAAWAINGWSLEEFSAERIAGSTRSAGHGDLWLGRERAIVTVEAKMCWIDHNVQEPEQCLRSGLAEGCAATCPRPRRPSRPACIGRLHRSLVSKPKRRENGLKAITSLEEFAQRENCATAKHLAVAELIEDKGRKYPGVLLVARQEPTPS